MGLKEQANKLTDKHPLFKAQFIYFFYDAATRTLSRYLGLYYKHTLLLSPHQVAGLLSVRTFALLFGSPILGSIADKLNRFRNILIISLFAYLATYVVVPLVEPAEGFNCKNHLNGSKNFSHPIVERRNGRFRIKVHKYNSELVEDQFGNKHYHGNLMYDLFYTWPLDTWEYEATDDITEKLFITLLLVTILGEFFASPSETFIDFYTLQTLGSERHNFGLVLIPGLFGWAIVTLVFTIVANSNVDLQDDFCHFGHVINYSPYLFIFYGLIFTCIVIAVFLKFSRYSDGEEETQCCRCNLLQALPIFLKTPSHLAFIVTVIFVGFGTGVKQLYIYHYITELGGAIILAPIIVGVHFISNVLSMIVSPILLVKYGSVKVLYLGLFMQAVTFVVYSVIENPLLIFLVEPFDGITGQLCWVAILTYVGTPSKIGAALQGLTHGLYRGFGMSLGYLLVSVMILRYGYVVFFLGMGLLFFFVLGFFITVTLMYPSEESIAEQYNQYHLLFTTTNNNELQADDFLDKN